MLARTTKVASLLAVGIATLAAGCSDEAEPGSSGVPAEIRLAETTPAQQAALCDWVAERQGGYGFTKQCDDGSTASAPADRAECLADNQGLADCPVTVGQFEACARELSRDMCASLAAAQRPVCRPVLPCL